MQYVACLLSLILLLQAAPARRAAGAHLKRGDLLISQNKVVEALASYDKAVAVAPEWATAYVKRGMARRAKGDLDGSIEDYEKAGTLDPRSRNLTTICRIIWFRIKIRSGQLETCAKPPNGGFGIEAASVKGLRLKDIAST